MKITRPYHGTQTMILPSLLLVSFIGLVCSEAVLRIELPELSAPLDDALPDLDIDKYSFPENFVFGSATAAYQVEGAAAEDGRGPSIWDVFAHTPGKILEGANGDVSADQYHHYEEDIEILESMGMDAYRFSISWSRVLPDGRNHYVNKEGVAYYNRLIDGLLSKGITPYVTLYHWDLPQALHEAMGGWLNRSSAQLFGDYAEVCFAAFGDRVKHWVTLNEPMQTTWQGYGVGSMAPGRTSDRTLSDVGNSSTEPYTVQHHLILGHATAVDIYRRKFQATQKGQIGIVGDCEWPEPLTDSADDAAASERRLLFLVGWFLDPIYFGDYPATMRENAGARLPRFSPDEVALIQNPPDFLGLNHYTTKWVTSAPPPEDPSCGNWLDDQCFLKTDTKDGVSIGEHAYSPWLEVVPWGFEKNLLWMWNRYKTPLYVTEQGMDTQNVQTLGESVAKDFLTDPARINYYHDYLASMLKAIEKGVDVRGYFAWSLLDNFEWALGFTSRFGLIYVDFTTQKRYAKDSARWFAKFLHGNNNQTSHASASS